MEHSVKSFTRKTKSGKTVTVRAHTRRSKGQGIKMSDLENAKGVYRGFPTHLHRRAKAAEALAEIRENNRRIVKTTTAPRTAASTRIIGTPSGLKAVGRAGKFKKGW